MRYNFLFFIFYFLIIISNSVLAIEFSPGYLNYEMEINQILCKNITVNSNSDFLNISDRWSENEDHFKESMYYTNTSDYHGLSLDYLKVIKSGSKFSVCISGNYSGEYHGLLIMQEEQVGSTIMRGGVWLNVSINGDYSKPKDSYTNIKESITAKEAVQEKTSENKSSITGSVIGIIQRNIWTTAIIFILIAIIAYLLILAHNRKKQNQFEGF